VPVWVAAVVLVLGLLALYSMLPHSVGATSGGPIGSTGGSLSKTCDGFGCTSPDAARALEVSDVWCLWQGSDVIVHAHLANTMAASVKLSIVPKYTIRNGGQHGTSMGSDLPVSLAAGQAIDWTGNAGSPEGVVAGTAIGDCKPHLHDIDVATIAP
jgi:hypothetical protein